MVVGAGHCPEAIAGASRWAASLSSSRSAGSGAAIGCGLGLAGVVCEQRDLDAVVEFEFLEEARDVRFYGCDAHVELAADFGVGLAASDGDGDLALAFGEEAELVAGAVAALAAFASGRLVDQAAGDGGGEDRLAGSDGSDCRTMSAGDVSLSRKPLGLSRSVLSICAGKTS